jgi:hypothetical protein
MKNYYPVWNEFSHGPACTAQELAALDQQPIDVIHFDDEENLVARLRLLGWPATADLLESKTMKPEPLSEEDEVFLRFSTYEERLSHGWRIEGDSADRDRERDERIESEYQDALLERELSQ